MSSSPRSILVIAIIVLCAGCPPISVPSTPILAGDSRLVGTWEGSNILAGYHVDQQTTFDSDGNYTGFLRVREDNSVMTAGGKWYAEPQAGLIDMVRTWSSPSVANALGTTKGYYDIEGDTLYFWGNPINLARPATREAASTYSVFTRKRSKEDPIETEFVEQPGIAEWLLGQ